MSKCKAPKIPPILKNNIFIINCKVKADKFIAFFSQQCKPLVNDGVSHISLTNDLGSIPFTSDDIIAQIHSLNPAKYNGPDGISSKMLILAWWLHSLTLNVNFYQYFILTTGIYPELWELANPLQDLFLSTLYVKSKLIVLEINLKKRKWLLLGIYNPPQRNDKHISEYCWQFFERTLFKIWKHYYR